MRRKSQVVTVPVGAIPNTERVGLAPVTDRRAGNRGWVVPVDSGGSGS